MKLEYRIKTDVLIIGSGGAGIRAAIAAADAGASVVLTGKCRFGVSGATFYPGTPGWGMQAVIHEGDTEEYFLEEILEAGRGAADPAVASVLAHEATDRFHDLEEMGLVFGHNEDGTYRGVIPCFGKRLRGSSTLGIDRIRSVMKAQLDKRAVRIMEQTEIIQLLHEVAPTASNDNDILRDGCTHAGDDLYFSGSRKRIVGAVGIDKDGAFFSVEAGAVILAAGGGCGIYKYSLATPDETGDACMLALSAGARLINMEFVQFIPGLTSPVKKLLFQEKNLITHPVFTNRLGEDILQKYLPDGITPDACLDERAKHGPFTTEDISFWLDIAMVSEAVAGNAFEDGGIQVTYDPAIAQDERWIITDWLAFMHGRNIFPEKDGFRMMPHAQCFNGGIYIDEKARTDVPGLFAAGECAGGAHGADRLGGAAIAATQVFGKIAGEEAAKYALRASGRMPDEVGIKMQIAELYGTGRSSPEAREKRKAVMEEIREMMWKDASLVRSEEKCKDGFETLAELKKESEWLLGLDTTEPKSVCELLSFLTLAEVMLTAIRERKESRGPHFRTDYPEKDETRRGAVTIREENGKLVTEWVRFPE